MVRVTRSKLARDNQPILKTNDSEERGNDANSLAIKVESESNRSQRKRLRNFEVDTVGISEAIEYIFIKSFINTTT